MKMPCEFNEIKKIKMTLSKIYSRNVVLKFQKIFFFKMNTKFFEMKKK